MAEEEQKKASQDVEEKVEEVKKQITSGEEYQICPYCGEKSRPNTFYCGTCGKPFKEIIPCPNCGKDIPIYFSFCSFCGKPLKGGLSPQQPATPGSLSPPQSSSQELSPPSPAVVSSQPFFQTSEEALRQHQAMKIETRKTTARIIGIIALVFAGLNLVLTIITIPLLLTDSYFQEILTELELSTSSMIAGMLAFSLPIISVLGLMGFTLIKPQMPTKPWKNLYRNFRYFFLSSSLLLAGLVFIAILSWAFYFPGTVYTDPEIFWLFKIFIIPLNLKISYLYLLILGMFLLATLLLILPTIITVIKKLQKKSKETLPEEKEETKIEETSSGGKLSSLSQPQQEPQQIVLLYKTKKERLQAAKERKGPMPLIFERIKNTPLIRTIELLGAMTVVSIVLVFLLSPPSSDTGSLPSNPFDVTFRVGWAGVFEELSFRLLLIGVPMIFVLTTRFFLQKHFHAQEQTNQLIPESPTQGLFKQKILNQPKLQLKDLFLAFRGKYKIMGVPEWLLIAFSSLVFGFAHWQGWTGSWGAWKIVQASVSGFFLSYAFMRFGLESAVFIHIANNLISSLTYYAYLGGADWIGIIASVCSILLLFGGLMKGVSFIINQVYVYHIVNNPPRSFKLEYID